MKITLKQRHRHAGEDIEPGQNIDVPDTVGDTLIKLGVAEAATGSTKKRNTTDGDDK